MFKGLPIQRFTTNLLLSRAGYVHVNCLEHPNSQDVPEKSLGDYSVDQGKDSARTLKMQQYSLHFDGQELHELLV